MPTLGALLITHIAVNTNIMQFDHNREKSDSVLHRAPVAHLVVRWALTLEAVSYTHLTLPTKLEV